MAFCDPLYGEICELFEEFVIPKNVIPGFRREKILKTKDIQSIEAKTDAEGPSAGARLLLDKVVKKENWFEKLQTVLCHSDVKLGHIANIMMHEKNRILEQQNASNRRSSRRTRVGNSGHASTLSALYIKYNMNLESIVRELFVTMVGDPVTILHVLQMYSNKVLTKIDCDNVKAEVNNKGNHEGADLLFSRLILYDAWLDVLLKALKDDDMRSGGLAGEIESKTRHIREEYARNRSQIQRLYNMNNNEQLEDNRMATDDPGSVWRINESRDNLSPDNFRDEYESDCAEMRPAAKRQAGGHTNKENTFSDGGRGNQNLASQAGPSENGHVKTCKTQLMRAAESGKLDLILNLFDGGASIDESDSNGRTALMYAVLKRRCECIQLLASKGCDVNKRDNSGCTALMIAADKGFTDCLKCLIQAKSNVDNANNKGFTALMVAAKKGFVSCMQLLIENHCDIDKCYQNGHTALMFAVLNGHSECVDLLIRSGCNVNKADNKRVTVLMYAAKGGQTECAKLLINGGANIDLADESGDTAVMWAVLSGETECLKLLVDSRADINAVNNYGCTPLAWAEANKLCRCVKILKEANGDW